MYPSDKKLRCPKIKDNILSVNIPSEHQNMSIIMNTLHSLITNGHVTGINSGSDLLCRWIEQGFHNDFISKIIDKEKKVKAPSQEALTPSNAVEPDSHVQANVTQSHLKSLLSTGLSFFSISSPIPRVDKYHDKKIRGKSISQAFAHGLISHEEMTNICTSVNEMYWDIARSGVIAEAMHIVKSKNGTRSRKRTEILKNKVSRILKEKLQRKEVEKYDDTPIKHVYIGPVSKYSPDEYEEIEPEKPKYQDPDDCYYNHPFAIANQKS